MRIINLALAMGAAGVMMTSCAQAENNTPEVAPKQEAAEIVTEEEEEPKQRLNVVGLINSDSIFSKYEYALDLTKDLESLTLKYEKLLRQKESALRSDMQRYQAGAPTMSQFEAQLEEKKLMEKRDKLQQKQEEYTRKLMVLEQDYNRKIDQRINAFLEEFCKDKPYELVISNSEGGLVRWAAKGSDITQEVLAGLNAEYAAEKSMEEEDEDL